MARYGQLFKDRAVAKLLPPQSAALDVVAREVGVSAGTLGRWRDDAHARLARGRAWTAVARLEAVVTTASMDEASKSAWCRGHSAFPADVDKWRASCAAALADPEEARASPQATRGDPLSLSVTVGGCAGRQATTPRWQGKRCKTSWLASRAVLYLQRERRAPSAV